MIDNIEQEMKLGHTSGHMDVKRMLSPEVITFLSYLGTLDTTFSTSMNNIGSNSIQSQKSTKTTNESGDGIVILTAPLMGANESLQSKESSIEIEERIPLENIMSYASPAEAVIQLLLQRLSQTTSPKFFFIRRPIESNTAQWILMLWNSSGNSTSIMDQFQLAHYRFAIMSQLPSSTNIVEIVCQLPTDIQQILPDLLTNNASNRLSMNLSINNYSRTTNYMGHEIIPLSIPEYTPIRTSLLHKKNAYSSHLPLTLSHGVADFIQPFLSETKQSGLHSNYKILNNGSAIVLRIDDTNSLIIAERAFSFTMPAQLAEGFDALEPKYYLATLHKITSLILYIPEPKLMNLRFLYPLCKMSLKTLLEEKFSIKINKLIDLHVGDSVFTAFHEDKPSDGDIGEQVLLLSETTIRPRPPITQMSNDPFLTVQLIISDTGELNYITKGGYYRFKSSMCM